MPSWASKSFVTIVLALSIHAGDIKRVSLQLRWGLPQNMLSNCEKHYSLLLELMMPFPLNKMNMGSVL